MENVELERAKAAATLRPGGERFVSARESLGSTLVLYSLLDQL